MREPASYSTSKTSTCSSSSPLASCSSPLASSPGDGPSGSSTPNEGLLRQASVVTRFSRNRWGGTFITINLDHLSPQPTSAVTNWGKTVLSDQDLLKYCSCLPHLIRNHATTSSEPTNGNGEKYYKVVAHLANNNLTDVSMAQFLLLLMKEKVELKVLRAHKNRLGKATCAALCQLIEQMRTPIEELHLSHNQFEGKDATSICIALFKKSIHYSAIATYPRWDSQQNVFLPVWIRLEFNKLGEALTLPECAHLFCMSRDKTICSRSMCQHSHSGGSIRKCPLAHILYYHATESPAPHIISISRPTPGMNAETLKTATNRTGVTPPTATLGHEETNSSLGNAWGRCSNSGNEFNGGGGGGGGGGGRGGGGRGGRGQSNRDGEVTNSVSSQGFGSSSSTGGAKSEIQHDNTAPSSTTTPSSFCPPFPISEGVPIISSPRSVCSPIEHSASGLAGPSSLFLPLTAPFLPPHLPPIPPPQPCPAAPVVLPEAALLSAMRDIVLLENEVALLEGQRGGPREHPLTCGVCTDELSSHVTIPCGHFFCATCLAAYASSSPTAAPLCPFCYQIVRHCQPLPRLIQLSQGKGS
eukprot:GHVS01065908.1.p1 GENE.GHVS01065908.1~~GHVS01065908.1.p1  ORF type:complete len:584 (+),score=90.57 GHVS01065908.1:235-1986(+)